MIVMSLTHNLKDVQRKIRMLRNLSRKMHRAGSKPAAEVVKNDAVGLAPVDTGALRDSIRVEKPGRQKRGGLIPGYGVTAGSESVPYAKPVEYGGRDKKRLDLAYMEPAFDRTLERQQVVYNEEAGKVAAKDMRRIRRS